MKEIRFRLLFVLTALMSTSALWAADGDVFTAKTVEGVDMTFMVLSEEEKTCYSGSISVETSGTITIPIEVNGYKVIGIMSDAFNGCNSLTSIIIPESVKEIGSYVFQECSRLTSILIPESVTTIGRAAFMGSGITNCSIPNGVKNLERTVFYGVDNLESLYIPNSVDSIGNECIVRCPNLKTIIIGSGINYIGSDNFDKCESLKDFYCYAANIPDTKNGRGFSYYEYPGMFYSCPLFDDTPIDQATLHVPAASLETYKTTAPWSGFGSIVPLTDEETGVTSVKAEQQDLKYYNLKGVRVEKPGKSLYIVNGKKVVM